MLSSRHHRTRRGSALLLCTLAAAVLSTAAIAILRSSQRSIARVESTRTADIGRHVTEGLAQRAIATLRVDPAASGTVIDPDCQLPEAICQLTRLSPTATQIQVFLYSGSTIAALDMVVDPTAPPIAQDGGSGSGGGRGGGRGGGVGGGRGGGRGGGIGGGRGGGRGGGVGGGRGSR